MAPDDESLRLAKSPRRVGIEYAAVVLVIAIIIAVAAGAATHSPGHRHDSFDRGFVLGVALAPGLLIAYAIGYFRQKRRSRE